MPLIILALIIYLVYTSGKPKTKKVLLTAQATPQISQSQSVYSPAATQALANHASNPSFLSTSGGQLLASALAARIAPKNSVASAAAQAATVASAVQPITNALSTAMKAAKSVSSGGGSGIQGGSRSPNNVTPQKDNDQNDSPDPLVDELSDIQNAEVTEDGGLPSDFEDTADSDLSEVPDTIPLDVLPTPMIPVSDTPDMATTSEMEAASPTGGVASDGGGDDDGGEGGGGE
jgi:hypothetical protein